MSTCLPDSALGFLRDLSENNHREWFQANKKRYERELKRPSRAFVEAVAAELERISPDHVTPAGKAISRINRDIRFSKDKTPYNTHIWAAFHNQTRPKGGGAGFYVGVSLEDTGIGAGCWMPPKPHIDHLRAFIAEHHADLTRILAELEPVYGPVKGAKYKRVPRGFDKDHPAAELLKHKGFHVARTLPLSHATTEGYAAEVGRAFAELKPLVDFLDAGLAAD